MAKRLTENQIQILYLAPFRMYFGTADPHTRNAYNLLTKRGYLSKYRYTGSPSYNEYTLTPEGISVLARYEINRKLDKWNETVSRFQMERG